MRETINESSAVRFRRCSKMKKWVSIALGFGILFALAGCGENALSVRTEEQPTEVNDVLEMLIAEENSEKDDTESQVSENTSDSIEEQTDTVNADAPELEEINESEIPVENTEGIDVDLTQLSSTMVYAEVYNMMVSPENYIGKTVKMSGAFSAYHDEATDNYYFACIIMDATACCSQGIEFALADDLTYPDDYPELGADICVIGVYDTYKEGGYTYCILRDAKIV